MTDAEIDHVLAEISSAVIAVEAEYAKVEREAERCDAAAEILLDGLDSGDPPRPAYPEPRRALTLTRSDVMREIERLVRQTRVEYVAWWAHAATTALLAALTGRCLSPVALCATGPWHELEGDDLTLVDDPGRDQVRELAALASALATKPTPRRPEPNRTTTATATTGRGGGTEAGRPPRPRAHPHLRPLDSEWSGVVDGGPEALRERLWGDAWLRHGMPVLPSTRDLAAEFRRLPGLPEPASGEILAALTGVEQALQAGWEAEAINAVEGPWSPEMAQRFDDADDLYLARVDRLANYAAVVTRNLPEVRSAVAGRRAIGS